MSQILLVCSMRYAFGRRSYVVSEVCELLREHGGSLTVHQRQQVAREIRDEMRRYRDGGHTMGDPCDESEWIATAAYFERMEGGG